MDTLKNRIDTFFNAYAARFNNALAGKQIDIEGTVDSFAECFIEASPSAVNCGKNNEKFRQAIPKGYEFYKSIGTQSMTICSKEITVLDAFHAMVKVNWRSDYLKKEGSKITIDFSVYYFFQIRDKGLKLFAYITGDEEKVLRENGLTPQ